MANIFRSTQICQVSRLPKQQSLARSIPNQVSYRRTYPPIPVRVYKNSGWRGYGDWLGNGKKNYRNHEWRPFPEARKFAQTLGLKREKDWRIFAKSNKRPDDIPYAPNEVYKDSGWAGYTDFLGTVINRKKQWRPFKEARDFVRTLNLEGFRGWRQYAASSERPDDIPSAPENHYRGQGWAGHSDWTGYEPKSRKRK